MWQSLNRELFEILTGANSASCLGIKAVSTFPFLKSCSVASQGSLENNSEMKEKRNISENSGIYQWLSTLTKLCLPQYPG